MMSSVFFNLFVLGEIEQDELVETVSLHVVVEDHFVAQGQQVGVVAMVLQQGTGIEAQFLQNAFVHDSVAIEQVAKQGITSQCFEMVLAHFDAA